MTAQHRSRNQALLAAVGAAALFLGCGISEEVYQRDMKALNQEIGGLNQEISGLRGDSQELAGQVTASEASRQQCLNDLATATKEKGALGGNLRAALTQLDEQRAVAAKRQRVLDNVIRSLKELTSAGTVKIMSRGGRMVVEISENILFDVGRSRLKPEGEAALAELAPALSAVGRHFQVTGHTDNTGDPEANWRLSMNRALRVLTHMVANGYPGDRVSAAGYAWFQPVASNDDEDGRRLNRRVEIVLVPNLEELRLPGMDGKEGVLSAN